VNRFSSHPKRWLSPLWGTDSMHTQGTGSKSGAPISFNFKHTSHMTFQSQTITTISASCRQTINYLSPSAAEFPITLLQSSLCDVRAVSRKYVLGCRVWHARLDSEPANMFASPRVDLQPARDRASGCFLLICQSNGTDRPVTRRVNWPSARTSLDNV
jgi:hypothetical protein